jgi:hypothetical protein
MSERGSARCELSRADLNVFLSKRTERVNGERVLGAPETAEYMTPEQQAIQEKANTLSPIPQGP